jgi:hypothetical protein
MNENKFVNALLFVFLGLALALLLHSNGIAPFNCVPVVVNQPCPCGPNCPCNDPLRPHNPYGPRRGSTGSQGSLGAVDDNGKVDPVK